MNTNTSTSIYESADFIRFARRHAYMMREGFFDGVKQETDAERHERVSGLKLNGEDLADILLECRKAIVEVVALTAGITDVEASAVMDEWAKRKAESEDAAELN